MRTNKITSLPVLFGILSITLIGGFTTHVLDVNPFSNTQEEQSSKATQKVSIIGYISQISSDSFTLIEATASDKTNNTSYTISLSQVETIETGEYESVSLDAIELGDQVIMQGTTDGSNYFATRLILLNNSINIPETSSQEEVTEEPTSASEPVQEEPSVEEPVQEETPTEEPTSEAQDTQPAEEQSQTETPTEQAPIEESQAEPEPEPTPEEPVQEQTPAEEPTPEEPQETSTQESESVSTEPLTE